MSDDVAEAVDYLKFAASLITVCQGDPVAPGQQSGAGR
jgi:hypothetical protein